MGERVVCRPGRAPVMPKKSGGLPNPVVGVAARKWPTSFFCYFNPLAACGAGLPWCPSASPGLWALGGFDVCNSRPDWVVRVAS